MKYLVNARTKEHCIYEGGPYGADWRIVEADEEGWIPWSGGECPLPEDVKCHWRTTSGDEWTHGINSAELNWTGGQITHYRPILATSDTEYPRRHGRTIVHIPESQQSVFDRLKSAIAASESIPAIIAEIDALLPEGYCVAKRSTVNEAHIEGIGGITLTSQPAEDMSDWRNWREGDLVTAHGLRGGYTENAFPENVPHTIVAKCLSGFNVKSSNGDVLYFKGREISRGELKFHSHPSKVTE